MTKNKNAEKRKKRRANEDGDDEMYYRKEKKEKNKRNEGNEGNDFKKSGLFETKRPVRSSTLDFHRSSVPRVPQVPSVSNVSNVLSFSGVSSVPSPQKNFGTSPYWTQGSFVTAGPSKNSFENPKSFFATARGFETPKDFSGTPDKNKDTHQKQETGFWNFKKCLSCFSCRIFFDRKLCRFCDEKNHDQNSSFVEKEKMKTTQSKRHQQQHQQKKPKNVADRILFCLFVFGICFSLVFALALGMTTMKNAFLKGVAKKFGNWSGIEHTESLERVVHRDAIRFWSSLGPLDLDGCVRWSPDPIFFVPSPIMERIDNGRYVQKWADKFLETFDQNPHFIEKPKTKTKTKMQKDNKDKEKEKEKLKKWRFGSIRHQLVNASEYESTLMEKTHPFVRGCPNTKGGSWPQRLPVSKIETLVVALSCPRMSSWSTTKYSFLKRSEKVSPEAMMWMKGGGVQTEYQRKFSDGCTTDDLFEIYSFDSDLAIKKVGARRFDLKKILETDLRSDTNFVGWRGPEDATVSAQKLQLVGLEKDNSNSWGEVPHLICQRRKRLDSFVKETVANVSMPSSLGLFVDPKKDRFDCWVTMPFVDQKKVVVRSRLLGFDIVSGSGRLECHRYDDLGSCRMMVVLWN